MVVVSETALFLWLTSPFASVPELDSMANQEHITDVVKPYDWTYSTKYNGTNASDKEHLQFQSSMEETIDIEQLKRPDPILFYNENILFEDELADNGTASLTTKVVRLVLKRRWKEGMRFFFFFFATSHFLTCLLGT